ncbi:hypothetical protein BGZ60DRAFT_376348 [Tricladium varicosporioides]|nr:hypothetical protein BGZ60DRAFT_376348 [Hymenoscyphus varicosporioides]
MIRLLQYNDDGELSLTTFFAGEILQEYAILSHTWEAEEVTFEDLENGTGREKIGYNKIRFCGEQARRDGLQYFWVDTCCIDKSSSAELSEAINSMFRWYRESTKCYVYLWDVLSTAVNTDGPTWEPAFRKSKWFTRGWTLQELIAPRSVEFFSKEGELLGDRSTLEPHVCEITGIPAKALQGCPLSDLSITERMSWAEQRKTTCEEDKSYSLLGIFDISMPVIYGEGGKKALKRLREEIDKASKVGIKHDDFSVAFSLSGIPGVEHFVARDKELAEIHTTLRGDGSRHTVVLYGLGGIGKTQLTVAYTKRHKDNYSAIFWLNIRDMDSVKQSFIKIARQILREHPSANQLSSVDMKENLDEIIDAVKGWLSLPNNTRWLIIYDNYDNPKIAGNADPAAVNIHKFLPESDQGSVIITTRSPQVKIGHPIQIQKLGDIKDGLAILSTISRREGLLDDSNAKRLAEELDGLPLALATAGAYLDQVSISCSEYLGLYKESWAKLQKMSPELGSYEDRTLYSTWQISFDRIERQKPLSAKLLRLWAYFDNQDIWFELLQHSGSEDPEWIRELTKDELSFHDAMRVLSNHGLVEVAMSSEEWIESKGYSMHGCVHSWTVHSLNQEWDYNLARLAVKFVGAHVPGEEDIRPWLTQRRLLQHALKCLYIVKIGLIADNNIEWAYNQLANLYADQGKLEAAEEMYERALAGYEKALGREHTSTLNTVNNLAILYADQGKLEAAEKMYERALAGYEKALGREHTSTLSTVNNLAILYKDQGKLEAAEKMYERALAGYEKALGREHTSTLNIVNNLATLYAGQGKLEAAEKMYERALAGMEKALGTEHTSTLNTVNNLAILYADQGKLEAAEKMYEQVLAGREKALGTEHTSTLDTVNNLANLYADQGKLEAAEKMYERALAGYEKAFGTEHTSTLNIVNNLATLYASQGKLEAAEKMYERAQTGYEKALGREHTSTLSTVNNLANLYKYQGKLEAAEEMYERAQTGYEKALGTEHTSTLNTVNNLANLYKYQGKLEAAKKMYERALAGYGKSLGADNATTYIPALTTIWNLGSLFENQTNFENARTMYLKALVGFEKVVGPDHLSSRRVRSKLRHLDERIDNNTLVKVGEPVNNLQRGPPYLGAKGTSRESKRNKLLKKIKSIFK